MGKTETTTTRPFTMKDVSDRELVLRMLRHEDAIILGEQGAKIYRDPLNLPRVSLHPEFTIHRKVLTDHGFDTSDESVANYRRIFRHYYRSPTDYDAEILSSVVYMRENKCVYYTRPPITVGDRLPDSRLYDLDGVTTTGVHEALGNDFDYAFVAGFSSS